MKIPRFQFIVAGLILVVCAAIYRASISTRFAESAQTRKAVPQPSPAQPNELELITKRDPVADATAAIGSNDVRFIAILGTYGAKVLGITDQDQPLTTNDVKFVSAEGQLFSRKYEQAKEYAAKYNQQVAEYRKAIRQKIGKP